MTTLKWSDVYYKGVDVTRLVGNFEIIRIGDLEINAAYALHFGDHHQEIALNSLIKSVFHIRSLTSETCKPQLAYHAFASSHRPSYMETYFPLIKNLDKNSRRRFHETITQVLLHPGFDIQLLKIAPVSTHMIEIISPTSPNSTFYDVSDYMRADCIRVNPALGYLVAGHIAELFFFRQDILDRLLNSTIHILLYTDQDSFEADGGVAGGCYNPERGCVQLVVSR